MNRSDMRGKGPRKPPKKEVTIDFLLSFYEAFLREYEITKIAAALDTTAGTLHQWCEKFPELKLAKEKAEKSRQAQNTFSGYIYNHLSTEAKKVWDEIQFWNEAEPTNGKVNKILSGYPKKLRQEIFVHALIQYGFNLSEACRIAHVSRQTLDAWRRDDYEFLQMIEEIEWHKRNFFEHALVDLVAMRNPGAVMFVNRTKNADRGYSEKLAIDVNAHHASGINIEELDLPIDIRKEILTAMRKKKELDAVREIKQLDNGTPSGRAEVVDV